MPTYDLHRNIKIRKIDDNHKCNTLDIVNEMVNDRCPGIFRNYFEIKENSYDFRTRDQLTIPLTRLCLGQHVVRDKGASLWNKIGKSLLNHRSKKNIKATLNQILSQQSLKVNCIVKVLRGKAVILFLAYIDTYMFIYLQTYVSIDIYVCIYIHMRKLIVMYHLFWYTYIS